MDLTWMAWTWPTAALFVFLFASIAAMGALEWRHPGGAPRRGILGLDTTRGDRLFISFLGSTFIVLGWLGLVGAPLWGALGIAVVWSGFVFWKV
jgi:predicted small integral membrane protein